MEHLAVGHVRDIARDVCLAQDALADAAFAIKEMEEIEDLEAARRVLEIAQVVARRAGSVVLDLEAKIELAS